MTTNVATRQNEDKSIRMLAAQRQIYSNVKKIRNWIMIFNIVLPLVLNLITFRTKSICGIELSDLLAVFSIIATIGVLALERYDNKRIALAALIQQKFDLYVFDMPWNVELYGKNRNIDEEIIEHSINIYENETQRNKLLNWYEGDISTGDNREIIYKCQRQSYSWDYDLRSYYQKLCVYVLAFIIIGLLGFGFYFNPCVRQWILLSSYFTPLFVSIINNIITIENDKSRLLSIKEALNEASKLLPVEKALDKDKVDDGLFLHRLQLVQGKIYEHRRNSFLIPDRFYSILKKHQEKKQIALIDFR